jgi:hypothetical protein
MIAKMMNSNNVKGNDRGLFMELSKNLHGGTENNHETRNSGHLSPTWYI